MRCDPSATVSVADVLRDHIATLRLDHEQAKAAAHILACRTGRLGGHLAVCDRCGHRHFAYHSCRDRHCPRCGSLDQALWAEAQLQHLLPVAYFHLVFTVPASLRPFFAGPTRAAALDALFTAVSQTILTTTARRGLRPGILAVLHTWTQKLNLHPHLHCLVTGGGLGSNGFVHRQRYLLPRKVLQPVFKAKLLDQLHRLVGDRRVSTGRHCPRHLLREASRRTWNIDIRRPLAGAEQVIRYFARYTRRIAISDKRLVRYDGHDVLFRWRDRAHGNRIKIAKLDAVTFCRAPSTMSCLAASSASAATICSAIACVPRCSSVVVSCSMPKNRATLECLPPSHAATRFCASSVTISARAPGVARAG